MNKILIFKEKKYGAAFVDRKQLEREFRKNQKLKTEYFIKKKNKAPHWELRSIKQKITW